MNMFERASKLKLRFTSSVGLLSVEDLWDLKLTGPVSLNQAARDANDELKAVGEESFVEVTPNPERGIAELRLDIIKHVIAEKQAAKAKVEKAAETAQVKREIIAALAAKQGEALRNMSEDELKSKLASLEA